DQVAAEADKLAASTRADVLAMEAPDFEDHFANVYGEPHPLIREELEWHRQYQAGFAEDNAGQAEGEAR
ncbi:MAG TPA: pyruvate dehydrogenase (acetyl-transferring) E1 component subunit alpha, partial [Arthrobacter sp.]|nr:pyruvate dehydrogenase (acetyl-transferring) E1 component subunit alpha [Arthrobacter sp.]